MANGIADDINCEFCMVDLQEFNRRTLSMIKSSISIVKITCAALFLGLVSTGVSTAMAQSTDGLAMLLADADITKGERVYRKCRSCHTLEADGPARVGPNLYGIVGGPIARSPDFSKYSDALLAMGNDVWTTDLLDAYLERPRKAIPGTTMVFAGLRKPAERANVIAYMNSFSDNPVKF